MIYEGSLTFSSKFITIIPLKPANARWLKSIARIALTAPPGRPAFLLSASAKLSVEAPTMPRCKLMSSCSQSWVDGRIGSGTTMVQCFLGYKMILKLRHISCLSQRCYLFAAAGMVSSHRSPLSQTPFNPLSGTVDIVLVF